MFSYSFGVKHESLCNAHDLLCPAVYVGSADVIVGVHVVSPSFKVGLALTLNDTVLMTFFFVLFWPFDVKVKNTSVIPAFRDPRDNMSKWLGFTSLSLSWKTNI